jgi:hypothetical protein
MCCLVLRDPAGERKTIEVGGPDALSPLDVVAHFEKLSGRRFTLEHIPEQTLRAQFAEATDSLKKSLATLMLGYLYGDAMNMAPVVEQFGIRLTTVEEYARRALGNVATP